jgi:dipeptidyl-peptidase-4
MVLPQPEFVTVPGADGTPLRAMLWRPKRFDRGPALVHVYGGPGSQLVADRFGGATALWHARMVARGYAVFVLDNRGCGGYGRDFCRRVSGRLCQPEVEDQAMGARWLARQPFVDPSRIAIWGWSYGGTMTLQCLLAAPDVFAAGVAVAPVTDWHDYDTAYTERYLGLPAENPEGYARGSPVTRAHELARPLLLVHGFRDDNVHFRGAAAFLDRAQQALRPVETDFYPRGAHGVGDKNVRKLLFRRIERFLDGHLGAP